ncbi:Do family serine endopeptidase [Amphibiibacter pelophylacis]|uniref:Do family serine endopeptidase n=1 Tax=Amphibiibacter pelophylacis TaxID=1799477 RepID=A0ACC6NYA1_9BURK
MSASDTKTKWKPVAVAAALCAGLGVLAWPSLRAQAALVQTQAPATTAAPAAALPAAPPQGAQAAQNAPMSSVVLPNFADLAQRVGPSVVNIRTLIKRPAGSDDADGGAAIDDQMRELFRQFGIPLPDAPRQQPRRRSKPDGDSDAQEVPSAIGSGFILSASGEVLTNAHVVDGASEVIVTLTDHREFKAKVLGVDKRTDVALLKIDASGLTPISVGDSNRIRVGEWVMAIGSPFGLDNTVTAGIVSAIKRDTGDFLPLIQTDVAINPGNSGGPLINTAGQVVGINSQIYSRSGGFMGISFSIPIDEAIRVANQLRANGRVIRSRIGVEIGPVSSDVAKSMGLPPGNTGAIVQKVEPGSPAAKAGLQPGDIITRVDGVSVVRSGDLPRLISSIQPGTATTLGILRNGKAQDLRVVVVELKDDSATAGKDGGSAPSDKGSSGITTPLGATVADLSDSDRKQLELDGGAKVLRATGRASRAGLRGGDVVLALNNVRIQSAAQFAQVAKELPANRAVTALVRRGDWVNYIVIPPGQ